MFGLNTVTMWVIGGLAALLLLAGGTVWYYKAEYDGQVKENGKLEAALAVQKGATEAALKGIDAWKQSALAFQTALTEMSKNQVEATKEARRLNDVLSKHDLGALADKKPGLVESRVNSGSDSMRRMLEDASRGLGSGGSRDAGEAGAAEAGAADAR